MCFHEIDEALLVNRVHVRRLWCNEDEEGEEEEEEEVEGVKGEELDGNVSRVDHDAGFVEKDAKRRWACWICKRFFSEVIKQKQFSLMSREF